jgi:16S rRNA (adenine1518-N6/adenine1519-N6)-dimethyltransferase
MIKAKKSLGQNFLIDQNILQKIITAGEVSSTDNIIEVGPGTGNLTTHLCQKAKHVTAVEIDTEIIPTLEQNTNQNHNLEIINQDVLTYYSLPTTNYKLIANIPYYITSPILKHFLRQTQNRPSIIVLLIQKEVAQKICNKKKHSLLGWEIKLFGEPEIVCTVPPEAFEPSPKVDSAVLKITMHPQTLIPEKQIEPIINLMMRGFKQPRKTLTNNLKRNHIKTEDLLIKLKIDKKTRPHQLNLENWKEILREI